MCEKKDQIRVLGPTVGGRTPALRRTDGETQPVVLQERKEGEPITTEILRLKETDCPITYDVESVFDPADYGLPTAGPPKVNSPQFRAGWDRVFGEKEDDLAN